MPLKQRLQHLALSAVARIHRAGRSTPPPLSEIRSFLLLQYPAWLGSAVHATPIAPALRAAVPGAEIVVCASGFALDLFRHNPAVDRLVETPNPTKELWSAARAIRAALPHGKPFATITTTHTERSTISLAAMLAGAGNFVGFSQFSEIYTRSLTYDPSISRLANNLRIVEALGHPAAAPTEPRIFFSANDLEHARTLASRFDDPSRPCAVLVTQTSPYQRKGWRPERFEAIARHLIERHGFNLVLVGASAERQRVEQIAQMIGPRANNVAGETTLNQLAALLSLCRVGVTLDTGTMHVGRATGLPMVIIAPAWSPAHEWLPLDNPSYIVLKNLDMPVSPPGYIIDEVSVEEVAAALDRLLAASHP